MSRDEISVMHLVGASTKFIKGPFVVSGMVCGIISAFLVVTFFAISTYFVTKYYGNYLVGFDLFKYYMGNFFQILGVLFGSGILLGGLASYLAVHKYLKN
jgi:cell division transport system permease protein